MPRVIKEAPIVEKQVVCKHCGRTIAYVNNDVQTYSGTDYGGGPDGQTWVNCPGDDCGKRIILSSW
jgi:hypothetical protein